MIKITVALLANSLSYRDTNDNRNLWPCGPSLLEGRVIGAGVTSGFTGRKLPAAPSWREA